MKTPPFLLASALLFWGWQTGLLVVAAALACALELSRLVRSKWDLSSSDFSRISDLCTVIVAAMAIFAMLSDRKEPFIFVVLPWLPIAYAPLVLSQVYSTSAKIDTAALFLTLRKRDRELVREAVRARINLAYPYFALCVLSAASANVRNFWFYAALILFSIWALWTVKSARYPVGLWMLLLAASATAGYFGGAGLHNLQVALEEFGIQWFSGLLESDFDPVKNRTAIGEIGALKPSNRIEFRAKSDDPGNFPLLLREAAYDAYKYSIWFAKGPKYKNIGPVDDGETWQLASSPKKSEKSRHSSITISARLKHGQGMLKLPKGAYRVEGVRAREMIANQFGAISIQEGPGLATYDVRFNPRTVGLDSPPDKNDLHIPEEETAAVGKIARNAEIMGRPPDTVLRRLHAYFPNHYAYSLVQENPKTDNTTPVGNFLLHSKTGHCEFFATSTVLLLRAAGIPARYAVGYSAHERGLFGDWIVVRDRHAHAWALAFIDGTWIDVDTTPPAWREVESENAPAWGPLTDLFSFAAFSFSRWRWDGQSDGARTWIWLLVAIPVFIIARRLLMRKRIKALAETGERKKKAETFPGADSAFYLVESHLEKAAFPRMPGEPMCLWLDRIADAPPGEMEHIRQLWPLLSLHNRYRFDPMGLSPEEKEQLVSGVELWIKENRNS